MNRILTHLNGIVGDQNTVLRYLFEKVCHTTFIAWCLLFLLHLTPIQAALYALIAYLIISKLVIRVQQNDWGTFWRTEAFWLRFLYIAWILTLPLVIAGPRVVTSLALWLVVYLVAEYCNMGGYAG